MASPLGYPPRRRRWRGEDTPEPTSSATAFPGESDRRPRTAPGWGGGLVVLGILVTIAAVAALVVVQTVRWVLG